MKKIFEYTAISIVFCLIFVLAAVAQQNGKETFTGTVLSYGSGLREGTSTRTFTLNITGQTSNEQNTTIFGCFAE